MEKITKEMTVISLLVDKQLIKSEEVSEWMGFMGSLESIQLMASLWMTSYQLGRIDSPKCAQDILTRSSTFEDGISEAIGKIVRLKFNPKMELLLADMLTDIYVMEYEKENL